MLESLVNLVELDRTMIAADGLSNVLSPFKGLLAGVLGAHVGCEENLATDVVRTGGGVGLVPEDSAQIVEDILVF